MNYKFIDVNKLTRDEARKALKDAFDYIQKLEEHNSELRSSGIEYRAEIHELEKDLKRLKYSDEHYHEYFAKWQTLEKENELLRKSINILEREIDILKKSNESIERLVNAQRELIKSRDRMIEELGLNEETNHDMSRKTED